jgi:2-polyprenyl-3-methyl-5-hydroxy-6-metoxy-1,4-benzoquinol methylase
MKNNHYCECKKSFYIKIDLLTKKPKLEIDYGIKNYSRTILQCSECKHIVNLHKYNFKNLYKGSYVKNNYVSLEGIQKNFKKIINIKKKNSDNKNRVIRIVNLLGLKNKSKILDIGSGLGVFPYEMTKKGMIVDCVEKDILLIKNLKYKFSTKIYTDIKEVKKKYFLITLNKVLEHIKNKKIFLKKILNLLSKDGFIYIEVPDYNAIFYGVRNREEFFIEHYHIFSEESLLKLALSLNLHLHSMARIKEPSGKFTLFGIFKKK